MTAPSQDGRRLAPARSHGKELSIGRFKGDPAGIRRVREPNDFPRRCVRRPNWSGLSAINGNGKYRTMVLLSGHVEDPAGGRMPDGKVPVFRHTAGLAPECGRHPNVATIRTRIESNKGANFDKPGA